MDHTPLRIVQISDTHLMSEKDGALLGVKTDDSFRSVVELLKQDKKKPDLILHSGDIAQDGSEKAYLRLATLLSELNVPIYCVPGNHDNPNIMANVYPQEMVSDNRHIVFKKWHLIMLNSQKPGAVEGFLDQTQLRFMQASLQLHPEHYAAIIFHHHPVLVNCCWLDKLGLINADEFWRVALHFSNIKGVFFGHVHQELEQAHNGIACFSAPSTCIQFKPRQEHFTLEKIPPGYRWIELYEDGSIQTGVVRAANYVGVFDPHAKGY
ncbi:MAG: Ser/Thr protein phosphatase [uncultured bacterium]|nr:MAG: Ser/Thr protein phosphatase [uncultured bacterium]